MPAPIEEIINEETRRKLEALRSFIEEKKKRNDDREFKKLRRGEPRYEPNTMSDEEYEKWKKTNREMSRLYDR